MTILTSRHPIVRATLGIPIRRVGRLRPKRTLFVGGTKRVHAARVGGPHRGETYSFRHVCFSHNDSTSVCGRHGLLKRGLVPHVLGTVGSSLSRAIFSFVPGATRMTFCKVLRKLSGCLGRRGMRRVTTLKRGPSVRRLRHVLSQHVHDRGITVGSVGLHAFVTRNGDHGSLTTRMCSVACNDLHTNVSGLIVVSSDVIHNAALQRDVVNVLSHLGPGGVIVMDSSPRIHCPSCCNVSVTGVDRFVTFGTTMRLLGRHSVGSIVTTTCHGSGSRINLPGRRLIGCMGSVCTPFASRRVSTGVIRLLAPGNAGTGMRVICRPLDNLRRTYPRRANS